MPIPQEDLFVVEQAGKPVLFQHISSTQPTGKMPIPQEDLFIVEQAGKPVLFQHISSTQPTHLKRKIIDSKVDAFFLESS